MGFSRIDQKDYEEKGVTGLPDIPRLDTLDMQKKFDELSRDVAFPKHNALVDELEGETAADSLGIADDVPNFENPTKKIKPLLVLFGKSIKENSDDRHGHENKTVLDSITDAAIKAWNKVSSLFENIESVENTVSGRASRIPSSMAIAKYVQQLGGGDMVKALYDRNDNDIVDDSEALGGQPPEYYQSAEDQRLSTGNKTVVGAINEVFEKTKDVLNTKEEIESNTDPTAIAGALSVKDLYNLNFKDIGSVTASMAIQTAVAYICGNEIPPYSSCRGRFQCLEGWFDYDIIRCVDDYCSGIINGHTVSTVYTFYKNGTGADPVLKKLSDQTANGQEVVGTPGRIITINCGFRPKRVFTYDMARYTTYLYDERISTVMHGYSNGYWRPVSEYPEASFSINDNGFSFKASYAYANDVILWFASER